MAQLMLISRPPPDARFHAIIAAMADAVSAPNLRSIHAFYAYAQLLARALLLLKPRDASASVRLLKNNAMLAFARCHYFMSPLPGFFA